jgi:hypothetical protein
MILFRLQYQSKHTLEHQMSKYNGWMNYETWRVNLEIFDGMTASDLTGSRAPTISELKDAAKEYAEQLIEDSSPEGLARSYALAFLGAVEWWEIADKLAQDAEESETDQDEGCEV